MPKIRGYSAAAVPILAGLLTLVGLINARRRAKVRSVDVPIADLPAPLHGFTIAQISDIHIGPTIKRGYVDAIVDAVNALEADMIAVTGDLVDGSVRQLSHHTEPMSRLSARHGAYFVTGNHEYYSGVHGWVVELRRLGLRVLMNEHVVLRARRGGRSRSGCHRLQRAPFRRVPPERSVRGAGTRPDRCVGESVAGSPTQVGFRSGAGRLPSPALRPYPRWPIPAVELLRAASAAVHGGASSPWKSLGLHQPRHRLLGPAKAPGRPFGDHASSTGAGVGPYRNASALQRKPSRVFER